MAPVLAEQLRRATRSGQSYSCESEHRGDGQLQGRRVRGCAGYF